MSTPYRCLPSGIAVLCLTFISLAVNSSEHVSVREEYSGVLIEEACTKGSVEALSDAQLSIGDLSNGHQFTFASEEGSKLTLFARTDDEPGQFSGDYNYHDASRAGHWKAHRLDQTRKGWVLFSFSLYRHGNDNVCSRRIDFVGAPYSEYERQPVKQASVPSQTQIIENYHNQVASDITLILESISNRRSQKR